MLRISIINFVKTPWLTDICMLFWHLSWHMSTQLQAAVCRLAWSTVASAACEYIGVEVGQGVHYSIKPIHVFVARLQSRLSDAE